MTLNFLDKILSDALNSRSSQLMIDERKRDASAKGKCQRLAKKLGLVFEVDRSYQPPLWTLEPGPFIDLKLGISAKKFDEIWPDERDVYGWEYTLGKLKGLPDEIKTMKNE